MNKALLNRTAIPGLFTLSALAVAFLFWLIYFRETRTSALAWAEYLPYLNALFNGTSSIFLLLGLQAIRRKQIQLHRAMMLSAFASSTLFLISYIVYHSVHGDTLFPGTGLIRPIYFFILITHIGLSIVALPMILTTFYLALGQQFTIHRKLARWTFPIWLYVSVTGVLIVLLLKLYT